jgi:hypothetical protein
LEPTSSVGRLSPRLAGERAAVALHSAVTPAIHFHLFVPSPDAALGGVAAARARTFETQIKEKNSCD